MEEDTNVIPGIVPVTCSIAQPEGGVVPEPVSKLSERRGIVACAAQGRITKKADDAEIISMADNFMIGFMGKNVGLAKIYQKQ
jgi:hypothetical protein